MVDIFLDIETIPTGEKLSELSPPGTMSKAETIDKWKLEKMPELIEEEFRKRSVISHKCGVISIGYGTKEYEYVLYGEEEHILKELNQYIENIEDPAQNVIWVGGNIRKFDLPILRMRAAKYGLEHLRWSIPFKKYDSRIVDLMDVFTPGDMTSMKTACEFFGIKHKEEVDGSKVYDLYLEEKHDLIKEYNKKEILVLRELWKKLL
jgi:predicted PolB exonuclease-like 3'-5' exonuclease